MKLSQQLAGVLGVKLPHEIARVEPHPENLAEHFDFAADELMADLYPGPVTRRVEGQRARDALQRAYEAGQGNAWGEQA